MRKLLVSAILAFGIALDASAAPATAPHDEFGFRAGLYTDREDFLVGAEWLMDLTHSFYFNPNLEYVFAGHDYATVNGDFHYDFVHGKPYYVWAGAGPALILRHDDPRRDDSDWGANLFAGFGWDHGHYTPYVQVKGVFSNDDDVAVALGVRF